MQKDKKILIVTFSFVIIIFSSCKKLIEIPPPVGTITVSQVFATDDQATSAAAGMYYNMINSSQLFSSGSMTIYGGLSADEFTIFNQTNLSAVPFQRNSLTSINGVVAGEFWNAAYSTLYSANAIIDGLSSSNGVHLAVKNELIGEAEFVRAFCNFYLTNLFGDIPLVTTINWQKTNLLPRTKQAIVYQAIITDLLDAQTRLNSDYSAWNGQRIIPTKWAAAALLARVYLYTGDYKNAEIQSSLVIGNSSLFSLLPDLNQVFLINSNEAIWQLQQNNNTNSLNATPEGARILRDNSSQAPFIFLSNHLLGTFENNDKRKLAWTDTLTYLGQIYSIPYKYKVGPAEEVPGGPYTEYYMVLRLAEQYLIRAEAEANGAGNGLSGAVSDLNVIRNRAGLPNYSNNNDRISILTAISHENEVEYFSEWGHRWLDLKRSGLATTVLSADKGFVVPQNSLLYPIPNVELITDHYLTQNPGY